MRSRIAGGSHILHALQRNQDRPQEGSARSQDQGREDLAKPARNSPDWTLPPEPGGSLSELPRAAHGLHLQESGPRHEQRRVHLEPLRKLGHRASKSHRTNSRGISRQLPTQGHQGSRHGLRRPPQLQYLTHPAPRGERQEPLPVWGGSSFIRELYKHNHIGWT